MTFGGLFSGIGGFELAATRLGIDVRWMCEIEPYCQKVLARHWPEVPIYVDIKGVDWNAVEPVDLLTGGPPCQPVSVAGERRGEADDRWLWPEVHRAVAALKPRWCCFENPPGLLTVGLHKATDPLESLGYEVGVASFPACAIGAPQIRERLWIIAHAHCGRFDGGQDLERLSAPERSRTLENVGADDPADCDGQRQHEPRGFRREVGGRAYDGLAEVALAHADSDGLRRRSDTEEREPRRGGTALDRADGAPGASAYVIGPRLQIPEREALLRTGRREERGAASERAGRSALGGVRGVDDGISAWVDGASIPWPFAEKKAKDRVSRVKALGNSVLPQCATVVLSAILAVESGAA